MHTIFALNADNTKGEQVGVSGDLGSAVAIACAVWQQGQQGSASWSDRNIGVFDDTDTFVAYIGSSDVGVGPLRS